MENLNYAVNTINTAVNATPQNHPDQAIHLSDLRNWLSTQFKRTGSTDNLNRAVNIINIVVNITP